MKDYVIKATAAEGFVRAFAVSTKGVTEEARRRHNLSPVASAALGRAMAAGLMMGVDLKNEDDLMTIQFEGDGPLGGMTVTSNYKGEVKGFVGNPDVMLPPNEFGHFDVGGAVGHGTLHIIKDIGLKEPYSGSVDIQTGEIAQDLTYYYAASEQVPSVVALGVLTDKANSYEILESGGYMIQLMPGCPDEIIDKLEEKCMTADPVTTMLRNGKTPEEMLELILGDMELKINEKKPVSFACNCSRERVTKSLIAIGPRELALMIADGEPITLNCQFCNSSYTFEIPELQEILNQAIDKLQKNKEK